MRQTRTRSIRPGFRSRELLLLTTLLDPVLWPMETLLALYERRWRVELYFDDIKTTLQASSMRCLTPAVVRRELPFGRLRAEWLLHAIAENLLRNIMLQSASQPGAPLDQFRCKGTLDTVRHWQHTFAAQRRATTRADATEAMLALCAADLPPLRPGRSEPRVLMRCPKACQKLTRSRHLMTVSPSRNHKGKPRKILLSHPLHYLSAMRVVSRIPPFHRPASAAHAKKILPKHQEQWHGEVVPLPGI